MSEINLQYATPKPYLHVINVELSAKCAYRLPLSLSFSKSRLPELPNCVPGLLPRRLTVPLPYTPPLPV